MILHPFSPHLQNACIAGYFQRCAYFYKPGDKSAPSRGERSKLGAQFKDGGTKLYLRYKFSVVFLELVFSFR